MMSEEKKGWFRRRGEKKAKKSGMFGGYRTRQEQLDAMEMGLQPSPLKQQKGK